MVRSVPTWASDHVGLIVAFVTVAFVATRITAVAGFDGTSAMAVLAAQGTATVLVGVLIDAWPALVMGTMLLALAFLIDERGFDFDAAQWTAIGVLMLFIVPWPLTAALAVAHATARAIGLIGRGRGQPARRADEPVVSGRQQRWVLVAMLLSVVWAAVSPSPWLPAEEIGVGDSDSQPLVGYALGRDGEDLIVLRELDRHVLRIEESEIRSRDFCDPFDDTFRWVPDPLESMAPAFSVIGVRIDAKAYPACARERTRP